MAAKLFGAVLLSFAGAAAGCRRLAELKRRCGLLSDLISALGVISSEISTLRAPLPDIFRWLSELGPGTLRAFFGSLAGYDGQSPFAELWSEEVMRLELRQDAKDALVRLGMSLGRYDSDRQASELELTRQGLEVIRRAAKGEADARGKIYPGLGAALGAMLAVILI